MLYEYEKDKKEKLKFNFSFCNVCKPHYHKQIEMFYVTFGSQYVNINGNYFTVEAGDFVFCNPYDIHRFSANKPHRVCFVGIPNDYLTNYYNFTRSGRLKGNYLPKCKYSARIFEIMKEFKDAQDETTLYKMGVVDKLLGYLIKVIGVEDEKDAKERTLVNQILTYIESNYTDHINVQDIANALNYSKFYISRTVNKTFNCNLNEYINLRRMEHFIELKKQFPTETITILAQKSGFSALRTFYRSFHGIFGVTPGKYFKADN